MIISKILILNKTILNIFFVPNYCLGNIGIQSYYNHQCDTQTKRIGNKMLEKYCARTIKKYQTNLYKNIHSLNNIIVCRFIFKRVYYTDKLFQSYIRE